MLSPRGLGCHQLESLCSELPCSVVPLFLSSVFSDRRYCLLAFRGCHDKCHRCGGLSYLIFGGWGLGAAGCLLPGPLRAWQTPASPCVLTMSSMCLCPDLLSLQGPRSDWRRATPVGLFYLRHLFRDPVSEATRSDALEVGLRLRGDCHGFLDGARAWRKPRSFEQLA